MNVDAHAEEIASSIDVDKQEVKENLESLLEFDVPIEDAKESVCRKYGYNNNQNTSTKSSGVKSMPKYSEFKNKPVLTSNDTKLNVGSDIGDGKEGMVYMVKGEPNLAVKIFKKKKIKDSQLEKKIKVMIQKQPPGADPNDAKSLIFAWPRDVVYYNDQFVGYVMPRVDTTKRSNIRTFIRQELPGSAPLNKRLKLAFNFASAVHIVHKFGYAIGDFNYENIFISKDEDKVTLIDCDSYSVVDSRGNEFHGETMYEETIPPEGRKTNTIERAQMADSFNVAVWLFRILIPTKSAYANPFQAKGNLAKSGKLLEMMSENPFPFWNPKSNLIEPVVGESTYNELPIGIRVLFESAFLGGKYHPYKRPSPSVWRDVIYNCIKQNQGGDVDLIKGTHYRPDSKELSTVFTPAGPDANFPGINQSDFDQIETRDRDKVVVGIIRSVSPLTEFDRDVNGEDSDREETGFVSHMIVKNPNGYRKLTFWDKQAVSAARSLQPGLVIIASGDFKSNDYSDGFDKELHVHDFSYSQKHDAQPPIDELSAKGNSAHVRGKILAKKPISSTSSGDVMNLVIADDTGHVSVALWNEMAERFKYIPAGLTLEIMDGYVKEDGNTKEISINENNFPPVVSDINIDYSVDCTPIKSVEEDQIVDVSGEIIDVYDLKEYDNGSVCQGLRINDESGTTIVNIYDEPLAIYDYSEGETVLVTNAESYSSNGYINLKTKYNSIVSVFE